MKIDEDSAIRVLARECSVEAEVHIARKEKLAPERVLLLFSPSNPLRRLFVYIGSLFVFDLLVYVSIIASCILLCITPVYDTYPEGPQDIIPPEIISVCNTVFTSIFTFEAFVRVMHHGLIFTKDAYLRSGWNFMDFMVLTFAWIDETNVLSQGRIVSVVRLARALRPLRSLIRFIIYPNLALNPQP